MALDMGQVVDDSIEMGTLTVEGSKVHESDRGDQVWHHEWCKNREGHTCCLILAGLGKAYVHDLDGKTITVHRSGTLAELGLTIMEF